jgi:DNA-binding transcriptional MerR regulator
LTGLGDRAYLSIGEVLSLLKDEFPDITISKIRFLESQGLLDPERTPSGYRKFYEGDVDRLRWILRQQREHFLPLKVIKGRLGIDEDDAGGSLPPPASEALAPPSAASGPVEAPPAAPPSTPPPAEPVAPRPVVPVFQPHAPEPAGGASLTMEELCQASGLAHAQMRELEQYGLIEGRIVGGNNYYDDEALAVAQLAAGFIRFGVGARHLRAFKSAAEREAGQFEAIVLPLLKQRNPQARQQALDTLEELSKLAEGLRSALLRQALRDLAGM